MEEYASQRRAQMKRWSLFPVVLLLTVGFVGVPVYAKRAANAAPGEDKTPPSYDMKPQAVLDLQELQKKFVSLAEATPAEKFTWRPAQDVRSISELYLHVALANYNIPTMMGVAPAAGIEKEGFEKSTTDKAKVIDQLNKSFAFAIGAVEKMSNADFAKPEKKLGPDANDGDVVYLLVVHNHEHLGQSIAYARSNGVVPPWTAAAMKKSTKAPGE